MSMNIVPLGDRVIVKPLDPEQKTKSGIALPDTLNKDKPEQGVVLAIGPGQYLPDGTQRPITAVKVGDTVIFRKYSPDELKVAGEDVLSILEGDIIGLVK